jgi:hypothetical protein
MSSTPRTDAHLEQMRTGAGKNLWASADFTRGLERENGKMRKAIAAANRLLNAIEGEAKEVPERIHQKYENRFGMETCEHGCSTRLSCPACDLLLVREFAE